MKRFANITKLATLVALAGCLMAAPAAARAQKLHSIDALTRALTPKIPQKPGTIVYVAFPGWKGKLKRFLLCKEIGKELAVAFAKALPGDKIYTPADAARILAKMGIQPLDPYFDFPMGLYGGELVAGMGAKATIASLIEKDGNGIRLTVSVWTAPGNKLLGKDDAVVAETSGIRELLSLPDKPVKDSSGVYEAGIGGVISPRCVHCTRPRIPQASRERMGSGMILLGMTVETNGSVADVAIIGIEGHRAGKKLGEAAVRAVRTWRLTPAIGPDKRPVRARMVVEITFAFGG